MKKQTKNVGHLALVVLFLLSSCNAWDALLAKADKAIAKAIAKADEKNEEAAEAEQAAQAKAAVRGLLGDVDKLLAEINKSNADLSRIAQAIKPLFAKVATAAAPKTAAPTPTSFVGLMAVVVPAEKGAGEPQVLPLHLVNNQALGESSHQMMLAFLSDLATGAQSKAWWESRALLFKQLDALHQRIELLRETLWQHPDPAKRRSLDFFGSIVEMHLDGVERAKVCTQTQTQAKEGEPMPAWFEEVSMLGLTQAAKKLLAE